MVIGSTWAGTPPKACDLCKRPIMKTFVDGRAVMGPWAIMCPSCRVAYGPARLGVGLGQKYERQPDGSFVRVA